jgi:hypothetical protein
MPVLPKIIGKRILVAGLCLAMLGGCATTKKAEVADSGQAETADDAQGILAKGGTTASNTYVDPMVTTAQGRKLARNGMPAGKQPAGGKLAQNALTQTYSSPSASMAGAVSEPTGVRAGNFSIFSSHGPAPATPALDSPVATASNVPASTVPTAGVNAMTRSVFSTGTPVACGNDANGNMISC